MEGDTMGFSAEHYEAMAGQVTDPAAAEDYRELAKAARRDAAPMTATLYGGDRGHDRRLVVRDSYQRVVIDAPGGISWRQEGRASDGSTETGRAFAKSLQLDDMARRVADPVTQENYRTMAKAAREEAGLA